MNSRYHSITVNKVVTDTVHMHHVSQLVFAHLYGISLFMSNKLHFSHFVARFIYNNSKGS